MPLCKLCPGRHVVNAGVLQSTIMGQENLIDCYKPLSYSVITQSSGKKLGIRVHRISKDIAALGREQDSLLSKLCSARKRILNLEEERQMITDAIARKEAKAMRPGDYQQVMEQMESPLDPRVQTKMDLLPCSETLPESPSEMVYVPSRSPSLERSTSLDITLSQIINDSSDLWNENPSPSLGFMDPQEWASLDELMSSIQTPILRSPEPSGGMDTWESTDVL